MLCSPRSDRQGAFLNQSAFPSELRATRLEILTGWKEIANHLHKGVRTVQRYEREFGMPIHRAAPGSKAAVIATTVELDDWVSAMPVRNAFQPLQPASTLLYDFRRNIEEMKRLRLEVLQLRHEVMRSLDSVRDNLLVDKPEALHDAPQSSAVAAGKTC